MTSEASKCGKIVRVAAALGITAAIWVFVAGLLAMHSGYGLAVVNQMGSVYLGYAATLKGSIIGAIWAFIDVFIFILIAGGIYCLLGCCGKGCCPSKCHTDQAPKS